MHHSRSSKFYLRSEWTAYILMKKSSIVRFLTITLYISLWQDGNTLLALYMYLHVETLYHLNEFSYLARKQPHSIIVKDGSVGKNARSLCSTNRHFQLKSEIAMKIWLPKNCHVQRLQFTKINLPNLLKNMVEYCFWEGTKLNNFGTFSVSIRKSDFIGVLVMVIKGWDCVCV